MADEKFDSGNIVELKSGGPKMSITELGIHKSGKPYVHRSCFVGNKKDGGIFISATLKSVEKHGGSIAPTIGVED